jgi:hypothetical protein
MGNVSLNRGNQLMRIKTYIILFVMFLPAVCLAQDLKPYSGSVVVVNADDNIKGKIESYISRELRSLGDIVVVYDRREWILYISALKIKSQSGNKAGIVISSIVLKQFNNKFILDAVRDDVKEFVSKSTSDLIEYHNDWLTLGNTDDLKRMCNSIVARFDTKHIKPERENWQHAKDHLKKYLNKGNKK